MSVAWYEGKGLEGGVRSYAFAFDQGLRDKVAQETLALEEDPNLPEEEWRVLLEWLGKQRLVFQNARFDLHHLRVGTRAWAGVDLEGSVAWDTMLASKILWPKELTGLKPTSERLGLTGGGERETEALVKATLKSMKLGYRYDMLPWSVIGPYAAMDTELTLRLWAYQLDRFDMGEGSRRRMDFMMEVMKVLYRMECRGIAFDVDTCRAEAEKLRERLVAVQKGLPFKPTVPGAKGYFFGPKGGAGGGLGLLPFKTTEKGSPQLDDEVQAKLVADGVPWALEYQAVRKLEVALSMWYDGYPEKAGADGRLRTSFRQTEVKSGRMSCERIQLQAIPKGDKTVEGIKGIKGMFRAGEGKELWNLDLSQAELRVATKYAGVKLMAELLAAGVDLHGVTTEEIFGIQKGHPEWAVKRDIAKRLTFGGIFQIGPKTFQATLAKLAGIYLPLGECETMVKRWRGMYPEFGTAYRKAEGVALRQGWVRLMPGTEYEERSYLGPLDWPHTAWNRIVQGSLALYNQIWLVDTERIAPGLLVLNVHDSQVLEIEAGGAAGVAREVAEAGAKRASDLFRTAMKIDCGQWGQKDGFTVGEDVWVG